jgi:hypothetical protein
MKKILFLKIFLLFVVGCGGLLNPEKSAKEFLEEFIKAVETENIQALYRMTDKSILDEENLKDETERKIIENELKEKLKTLKKSINSFRKSELSIFKEEGSSDLCAVFYISDEKQLGIIKKKGKWYLRYLSWEQ